MDDLKLLIYMLKKLYVESGGPLNFIVLILPLIPLIIVVISLLFIVRYIAKESI